MIEDPSHEPTNSSTPDGCFRPRILLVTDRIPGSDNGNGIRIANVIEGLRLAGELEIALIDSSVQGAQLPAEIRSQTHIFRFRNPPLWAKPRRFLHLLPTNIRYHRTDDARQAIRTSLGRENWDLVWCSRARVHLLSDGVILGPRIVDFDDLTDRLLRSEIADRTSVKGWLRSLPRNARDRLDSWLWSRLQCHIAAAVDQVVVCSSADRAHLAVSNCVVVPNCVVVRNGYPDPPSQPVDRPVPSGTAPRLLFTGPLTYEPNRLGVTWFIKAILPAIRAVVPAAEFVVVGDHNGVDLSELHASHVTFVGWVPDVTDYYASATVAVVPLHSGGGTRLKVIEALARSVPLVSTPFGCGGHELAGDELLVADDASQFADRCCELLTDASLRARLVEAGRRRYESTLTSEATSDAVHQLAASVASNGRRRLAK